MNYDAMMKAEGNKEMMKRQEAQAAEAGRNEVAGSESAQGAFIMDMRPEQSATQLREAKI